jgi:hypothetical protein
VAGGAGLDRAAAPLATETLVAIFQQRMTQATEKAFGRELDRRAKG